MSQLKKIILLLGDIGILYASLGATILLRYGRTGFHDRFATHVGPLSLIFILWIVVFYLADLYRHKTLRTRSTFFRALIPALIVANVVSIVTFYLFGPFFELTPKTNLFILSAVFLVGEYVWRTIAFGIFHSGSVGLVLLGESPLINEMATYIGTGGPGTGYRMNLWIKSKSDLNEIILRDTIANTDASLVVLHPELTKDARIMGMLYRLLPLRVTIMNFSDFYESVFERIPLREIEEGWFIEHVAVRRPIYDTVKRLADLVVTLAACVICIPLGVLIAFLIKLTSRGPIIYKQARMGKGGRTFMLYKFRTMQHHETEGGAEWSYATTPSDARITGFGKMLRFTHLDEIPQLINILRGDISVTGPRPERVELAQEYAKLPYYEIRHIIKPGLTGWAQINYRPSVSLEEAYEKLEYDIYYVKNRAFLLDLLIILRTVRYFFVNH